MLVTYYYREVNGMHVSNSSGGRVYSSSNSHVASTTGGKTFGQKVMDDFKSNVVPNARHGAETGAIGGAIAFSEFGPPGVIVGGITGASFGALGGVITTGWQAIDNAVFK